MQKNWLWIVLALIVIIAGFLAWQNKTSKSDGDVLLNQEVTEENMPTESVTKNPLIGSGLYAVDTDASIVRWAGKKPLLPNYTDTGIIKVKEGTLTLDNGMIVAGTFTIDMATIAAESTGKGSGETMLTRHLQSSDFFDAEQYPVSTFEITSVKKGAEANMYEVTGDLTLKGTTASITFPAEIYGEGEVLKARATTQIDRTVWNVRYGSGKFFDNIGDNLIDDMFTVEFDLVTHPIESK